MNFLDNIYNNILKPFKGNKVLPQGIEQVYDIFNQKIYKTNHIYFLNKFADITELIITNFGLKKNLQETLRNEYINFELAVQNGYKKECDEIVNIVNNISLFEKVTDYNALFNKYLTNKEIKLRCVRLYFKFLLQALEILPTDINNFQHFVNSNNRKIDKNDAEVIYVYVILLLKWSIAKKEINGHHKSNFTHIIIIMENIRNFLGINNNNNTDQISVVEKYLST